MVVFASSALTAHWWICFRMGGWAGKVKQNHIKWSISHIFSHSHLKYSGCISQPLICISNLAFNISSLSKHLLSTCWSEGRDSLVICFFVITALVCRGLFVNMWDSGECGLAGWQRDAVWAAVCLGPGSVETRWVPRLSLIVWRSHRSQKFPTHRGSDPTWPDPT